MTTAANPLEELILNVREQYDADLFVYIGGLYPPNDVWFSDWLSKYEPKRNNALLMLRTNGGVADVAYRIARQFQLYYKSSKDLSAPKNHFYVYVEKECKSAGTLLAIGADILIMSDQAELGPLDVQLRKPDEVGERTSGLTPLQALESLRSQSIEHFKDIFGSLRFDTELAFSTKMAADISTKITVGLLNSIYAQIDPVRISEIERLLSITSAYGERLSKSGNLQKDALDRLLTGYPSHGFVIDKVEAAELFTSLESPTPELKQLCLLFNSFNEDAFTGKSQPVSRALITLEENETQAKKLKEATEAFVLGNNVKKNTENQGDAESVKSAEKG